MIERVREHRRDSRSRALENHELLAQRVGEACAFRDVAEERLAGHTAAAPPASHRGHATHHRVLVVVTRRVLALASECEQVRRGQLDALAVDELRLGGAASAHRQHHDVAPRSLQQPGDVCRDRGLAHALARPDDAERRSRSRHQVARRREREVRSPVGDTALERDRGQPEAVRRGEHRLVGEVHELVRCEPLDRRANRVLGHLRGHDRHAVGLESSVQIDLLGPADERSAHDLAALRELGQREAHHRRVVLAVDQRDEATHGCGPSSST